ncbi:MULTISPECIES: LexA family transcriptional regulator [unclassified Pedobacter]|uniref:LexA family transcriptional regulator n=1 Tax=Pedobacter TaxID=84567 RepID=UPI0022451BDF|nr:MULTISPECIES: S24 family peptidase [unclassified Pedobacter]MCX2431336.1 helix-turn-helix domain-containing protein [Pedobacter sp. GR22-10]MCX2585057.1 helix-turn-helix domain-containing protein [Pedobacter sp. MR22-3]
MNELDRLKLLMDILGFKTQRDFAAALNIKDGSLSDILRGRTGISNAIKDRLNFKLNINIEWLETGVGEAVKKIGPVISEIKEGVPYYDISLSDTDTLILMEEKAEYFVNYKPFNDCTAYLPVYGDSMYPRYASGEIIAVREVTNYDVLQWGEAYVVMADAKANYLRSIKMIYEHTDRNKLILRSSNPNFKGDTIIEKSNITSLYIIKGKITRNLI